MTILQTGKQIGRTIKNAARLRTIVGVFAKHGFHKVAEKIKLGRFIIERLQSSPDVEKLSMAERVRISFEELGPTFVKLGQVLATRPDLVPQDFVDEFEKLHDRVQPVSFQQIEEVLFEEFGENIDQLFESFESEPIGSASIAQVHKAKLKDGTPVVVKVQRPGIMQVINDDLNVLYFLGELLETYIPETRPFNPVGIIDEFFKTLELETNFIVEANNIRRFSENFTNDPQVKIPKVYLNLTTERVLVMEALQGVPLSSDKNFIQSSPAAEEIVKIGLRAYLKMVYKDGLFHGDLHAGNFFVLGPNQIGLVDFGVVGRLSNRTQTAIANMLIALKNEDYERLAFEYVDLAPFSDKVNVDLFAKDVRATIAPYYGLTLKNINLGKLLMSSSSVAARHHLTLPTELMLFFKSIVSVEGIGRKLIKDFDFLSYSLEIAAEMVKHQYEPTKLVSELSQVARESRSLINALPRQINFYLRRLNSPDHKIKISIDDIQELKKSVELSFNLLFLGIIIAALLLSSSLIHIYEAQANIHEGITLSLGGYILAGALGLAAFVNYIKK